MPEQLKKEIMTLKEKFRPHAKYWDCYNDEPLKYDHGNKCAKIAEEFAIGFAKWLRESFEKEDIPRLTGKSEKELLEIYKKEKQL